MTPHRDRAADYVVEHRDGDNRTVVAAGVTPLAPIAADLAANGEGGELVVVRRGTGELVVRWPLSPADGPDHPRN